MLNINIRRINWPIVLASFISCYIAFYNRFPLVYQDTGTYIDSGFSGSVPYDRPIFYGYFMRMLSFSHSVWLIVFVQSVLVCSLTYTTLGLFFNGIKRTYIFLGLTLFLTFTTGYSYHVSILIPDLFSPIAVLCVINLLMNKQMNRLQTSLMALLFIFSVTTQFSSILILTLLFGVIIFYMILQGIKKQASFIAIKKLVFCLILFGSCLFIIPTAHYCVDRHYKFSGSNHIFAMNHLLETGILEDYLEDACKTNNYRICEYKDNLGWDFIWSPESPLQKTGGWEVNRVEYKVIIKDIISTPRYFGILLQKGIEYSVKQFFAFEVAVVAPQLGGSGALGQIKWRYKDSLREYESSFQNQSKLKVDFVNALQFVVVLSSLVLLIVSLFAKQISQKLGLELKWAIAIILIHNIINSVVCGNFSSIDARYQNRLIWLFPFFAIIVLIKLVEQRKSLTELASKSSEI